MNFDRLPIAYLILSKLTPTKCKYMHNLTSRSILFGSKLIKQRRSYYKPLNYVERLSPVDPSKMSSIPTYRVLDNDGNVLIKEEEPKVV